MSGIFNTANENNQQYTLDSQLAQGETSTLVLNENVSSKISASASRPGHLVVDRVDSAGNKTSTAREYITFTGVSGSSLTGLTRGLTGSTDQVHAVGAIVEFVFDVLQLQAIYDTILKEHSFEGVHASLASVTFLSVNTHLNVSGASLTGFGFGTLSIEDLTVTNSLLASGASLQGLIPIRPFWFIPGTVSGATTSVGAPMSMPETGTVDYVTITLQSPISGASLIMDINKNFTSIFEAGTRPFILGGGTFVSTASINTKAFNRGDQLSVDLDAGGEFTDATIQLHAR